jgi:iron complex outermembrane recepter protein
MSVGYRIADAVGMQSRGLQSHKDKGRQRRLVQFTVRSLIWGGALASTLTFAPPSAFAADAAATDAPADNSLLQEVVVTGSRLSRPGMTSPTPITALSSDELALQNPQSLTQGLAQLPALANSTIAGSMGGRTTAGPGNFLNLRNLGSTRTLILLDGERIAPSNVLGNVDVNLLPQALVSSVDVVTGGASAAYGSDAVAGVVNYILNDRFSGFKADVNAGISSRSDGASGKVSLAWGHVFAGERLHLEGSFDWLHQQTAFADNRLWSSQHCGVIATGVTAANATAQNPMDTLACNVTQPNSAYGGVLIGAPWATATGSISFGANGVPQPFVYGTKRSTSTQVGGASDAVPVGNVVNFSTPLDRKILFGRASFSITSDVEAFAQINAARVHTPAYPQTPGYFNGSTPFTLFSGNPFIPASIQNTMTAQGIKTLTLGVSPFYWGNIKAQDEEQSYDGRLGLKGKFGGSYSWDVHAEHARTQFIEHYPNDINLQHVYQALNTVTGPLGTPIYSIALTNPTTQCAPLDVFGTDVASAAALAYIHGVAEQWNVVSQTDVAANINGEPFSLWAGPVSLGLGFEWRRLEGSQSSDAVSQQNDGAALVGLPAGSYPGGLAYQTGGWLTANPLPYSGSIHVREGYVETLIPLLKDQLLAKSLDLNAAGRVTNYSQSGTVTTWKTGLTYSPVNELLIRVTESADIRAPGISDLYSRLALGPPSPLTGTNIPYNVSSGSVGNATLKPEKARTLTGGFTWQPGYLPGFSLSADYYDIKISGALASTTAADTINRCNLGEQVFCGNIVTNAANGTIAYIVLPEENLSQARTRGVDFEANYRAALGPGRLSLRAIATRLLEQSNTTTTATGAQYQDLAGSLLISPGGTNPNSYPHWLATGIAGYDIGSFGVDVVSRFVGSGNYYAPEYSPAVAANVAYAPTFFDVNKQHVPSIFTFNAGAHYGFGSAAGAPEVYFQVTNLFDKSPPILGSSTLIGFQTASSMYDTLGRYFTLGVRATF